MPQVIKSIIVDSLWKGAGKGAESFAVYLDKSTATVDPGAVGKVYQPPIPEAGAKPGDMVGVYLSDSLKKLKAGGFPTWALALIKGSWAAIAALPGLFSASGILCEVPFLRPLRKAFSPSMPGAGEIIAGYRKGSYNLERARDMLGELGYASEDIEALFRQSMATPGLQDVIDMACAGIFNPGLRQSLGMDQEVNDLISGGKSYTDQIGVDPQVLRDFWAAHWKLPDPREAVTMYQRGIITQETMDAIFKVSDVLPFWRDKIFYAGFNIVGTREIRMMHKAGVIQDADRLPMFRAAGYGDLDAQRQANLTIKYFANPENAEETYSDRWTKTQRDLSTSDVLDAYKEGIKSEADTRGALASLGYATDEAEFLVSKAGYEAAKEEFDVRMKYLKSAYLKGIISRVDVVSELGKLALPGAYQDRVLSDLDLQKSLAIEMPTRADLLGYYKKELMTALETRVELLRMGYSEKWIAIMLQENQPVKKVATPSKTLGKS
jgi:hypothetical protein